MKNKLLIVICFLLLTTGCINKSSNNNITKTNKTKDNKETKIEMQEVKVIINNETYSLNLEDNKTVDEFINLLPQEFNMSELNGNEKYVYLDSSLPTNSFNPKRVNKGDVMLFGDNCLVIFYESFNTPYSYTKIGHIDNLPDLGNSNITIIFEKER